MDVQMSWKEQEKKKQEFEKMKDKEVTEKQVQYSQTEEQIKKVEERERQQMYGQALAYQYNLQQLQKQNYGKMTWQEKRINRDDLQHFKEHQDQYSALIPGLNNLKTVGAAPLKRARPIDNE